jgi:hypothetical protein
MSALRSFIALSILSRRGRIAGLAAFGVLFLLAAATARIFTGSEHGHMEVERLFEIGGTTLVSALLLLGWLVGRFPIVAVLVLMSGVFSDDRAAGHVRLLAVRPRSLVLLYGMRALVYALIAFLLSIIIMPAFDLLILGEWSGTSMLALITGQILIYGALTALLSVITRADAWVALFLGILSVVWDALRRADFFGVTAAPLRETVSVMLPPQGALLRIEAAFAGGLPVPWDALLYIGIYAALALMIAGVALVRREI